MARTSTIKNYFVFDKGLMTEASPLTYPPGASYDEDNMDLRVDGSRWRRRAIDYENSYTVITTGYADTTVQGWRFNAVRWLGVAGNGNTNFLIVQMGRYLKILNLDSAAISSSVLATIDLDTYKTGTTSGGGYPIDVAFGNGIAYVTNPVCETFYISYDATGGTFSTTQVDLSIRDLAGIDDTLAVDNRPSTLSNAHQYNLLNQGWDSTNWTAYNTADGVYPSNADIWVQGKDSTGNFAPATMDQMWFGSSAAPRGHYIYNPFSLTRSTYVGALSGYDITTNARPSTCAFFAGRFVAAGVDDPNYSGTVFISKVIQDPTLDSGKCYQIADPTSEVNYQLVADDGLVIRLPEAGSITKVITAATGLLIFAKNGVWFITGSSSQGFAADLFTIQKVSSIGTASPQSIVEVEGTVFYWTGAGIYMLQPGLQGLTFTAENITQNTIQTKFDTIPLSQIDKVVGVFDPLEREVKWFYSTDAAPTYTQAYDKKLVLDIRLKAFYTASLSGTIGTNPHVVAAFATLSGNTSNLDYGTMARQIALVPTGSSTFDFTVSAIYNTSFMDWETFDSVGVDYTSYLITGYELFQDAIRNKQIDTMSVFFNRTELTATNGTLNNQSGCQLRIRWDWSDSASSQKWSASEQAYDYVQQYILQYSPSSPGTENVDYGYNVITTKRRISGTGRALQVAFTSETGKDMQLLGWAIEVSGNTVP